MTEFSAPLQPGAPLSEDEFHELDRFLASDATSDQTMMIDAIDGYLTALSMVPADLPVERWLPVIWGPAAEHAPTFASREQERRIADLILRQREGIRRALDYDPDDIAPIFDIATYQDKSREYLDGEMWAYGFMRGVALARDAWQPLFDDAAAMDALLPIYILGGDDVTAEQLALGNTPAKREALTEQIAASVGALWRFWHPEHRSQVERMATPVQRAAPKVGRNDPCSCGSGKKWKKCCGAH